MNTSPGISRNLPIAVIGAGPIGLVAAAHLLTKGETPLLLEAGASVGTSVRTWGHVRLFTPWNYLTESVSRGMLEESGWRLPEEDALPTGSELVERFLEPLAALPGIAPHILLRRRVVGVTRQGLDRTKSAGREDAPFQIVARRGDGGYERYLARAVIDASGTFNNPNPLGAGGLVAEGEVEHRDRVEYGIPDVLGRQRARYSGQRTLVVGSGHSAFNVVLDLVTLARDGAGTTVIWAIRRRDVGRMFGGGGADALTARGGLGERLRTLVEARAVKLITGFHTRRVTRVDHGLHVEGEDTTIGPVDEIVVTTGFRPDLEILRELRLGLDPALESPTRLAPLIDPEVHSCGTVYPHGYDELKHPEKDFFVVGMKSYGRAPTFLLLTGYEQVRSVVCGLTGDLTGARDVRLVLPETGVCSTDSSQPACCSSAVEGEPSAISGACGIASACGTPRAADTLPPSRTSGSCV